MSDETRKTSWTVDTLHQHLIDKMDTLSKHIDEKFTEAEKRNGQRFDAQQIAMQTAINSQEKAVKVAEDVAEKWRTNANEWRATLSDRDQKFMLQETSMAEMRVLREAINDLKSSRDKSAGGRASLIEMISVLGIIVAIVLGLYAVLKH